MTDERERFWLTYNGEIYNFLGLREDLLERGHRMKSRTDSEVIVHLWEEMGLGCLDRLRGMFAFAIWDKEESELVLVRDRIGVKPLYYMIHGNRLLFASEIKALLCYSQAERRLDPVAIHDYLTYLYIPPPRTAFEGIHELPPGHWLKWRGGTLRIERYWDVQFSETILDEEEAIFAVQKGVREAVDIRRVSDVPIGALLSGGLDSSVVVGLLAQTGEKVNSFTIGFGAEGRRYDERDAARRVAQHFGTHHRELEVDFRVAEVVPEVVTQFDQPFGNPTAVLIFVLSKMLKEHVSVALAGDGGDEVFLGYPRYLGARIADRLGVLRQLSPAMARAVELIPESRSGHHTTRRLRQFLRALPLKPGERCLDWVGYLSDNDKHELYEPWFQNATHGSDSGEFVRALYDVPEVHDPALRASYVDLHSFLPFNVLQYSDRMSMAHGLELRVPFTDHKVVETAASISGQLKLSGRQTKWILRKAFEELLPEEVTRSGKIGLNPPIGMWLRDDLAPLVEDTLSTQRVRSRGLFNPSAVTNLVRMQRSGKRDNSLHVWALVALELWCQAYMD